MTKFPRTPPRLDRIFRNNPLYFITCCSFQRQSVLANEPIIASFNEFAERAYSESGIAVGRYVIMPDHIHLFVCGPDDFLVARGLEA
jgi:putative transposase